MTQKSPVGVFGLGLMGTMFAERLMAAGFDVVGYDIVPEKTAHLASIGGHAAASGADVARRCDTIIIMVFDIGQAEDVVQNDILQAVGPNSGKVVICSPTCDPNRVTTLGAQAEAAGLRFLEAPVSGTSQQCREGLATGLIGGDPELADTVRPVLAALYPRMFHIGRHGDGNRAKLAINLILGINRTALAEGLVFAEAIGLDPSVFFQVAKESAAYSRVMDGKGPKMLRGDFKPEGMMHVTFKDSMLMEMLGEQAGQPLPMHDTYRGLLKACMDHGHAELDNSSVIMEIRGRRTDAAGGA